MRQEIKSRRTFAIISHPDAGKTTMTEKLLLYGGAINMAGSVKARRAAKFATSDWMDIEKQRGISVTSSAMQFNYDGYCINILDTPGHQDFSEDTYRTLMAADSAVMLIDGAKGVEPQTIKLFQVCRLRNIPIFTFVNKMDRAAKDPFELMDEIETVLGIRCYPMNWPIGTEGDFKGVYDRQSRQIQLYSGGNHGASMVSSITGSTEDESFRALLDDYHYNKFTEELELLDMAGDPYDYDRIIKGELTPMFFGSAMNNFGVEPFLKAFLELAPCPGAHKSSMGKIEADDPDFSGFIFKIQANMNPAHRDRIAFMRICSGHFEKGMEVTQTRTGRQVRLAQPQQFMAQDRVVVEDAWPGDIIGIFDQGDFTVGDTVSAGKKRLQFEPLPVFPCELFATVSPKDSMKRKQFSKGVQQLAEEGAVQIFRRPDTGMETIIIGAVGELQFEVFCHRMKGEYGVDLRFANMPHSAARWIDSEVKDLDSLKLPSGVMRIEDNEGMPVLLFENRWSIDMSIDRNPGLELREIKLQREEVV